MPDLELLDPGIRLASESPSFEIQLEGETVAEVPWGQVEGIYLGPGVGVSAAALAASRRLRIPVIWTTADGRPLCWREDPDHERAALRLAQARALDSPIRFEFARAILQAKLLCMGSRRQLGHVPDLAALRGIEGDETRNYYQRFFQKWPEDWRPSRRSKRPPADEANSLLSYGYSLLSSWMLREILVVGLDPSWGFIHEVRRGMPGLVQDLIEPFRSAFVDHWTLEMVREGAVSLSMFEERRDGVWLKDVESRKRVVRYLMKRLDEPMPGPSLFRARTTRKGMRALARAIAAGVLRGKAPEIPVSGLDLTGQDASG
jgi:CRISPR-associated protein Cas1